MVDYRLQSWSHCGSLERMVEWIVDYRLQYWSHCGSPERIWWSATCLRYFQRGGMHFSSPRARELEPNKSHPRKVFLVRRLGVVVYRKKIVNYMKREGGAEPWQKIQQTGLRVTCGRSFRSPEGAASANGDLYLYKRGGDHRGRHASTIPRITCGTAVGYYWST
jgi:hypothetical protein